MGYLVALLIYVIFVQITCTNSRDIVKKCFYLVTYFLEQKFQRSQAQSRLLSREDTSFNLKEKCVAKKFTSAATFMKEMRHQPALIVLNTYFTNDP